MTVEATETSPVRILFGLSSSRTDKYLLDEVHDSLEILVGSNYDLLAWRRASATRFIVHAPVSCRSIIDDEFLKLRSARMSVIAKDMSDDRNEWVEPDAPAAATDAQKTLATWMSSLWDINIEDNVEAIQPVKTESEPDLPSPRRLTMVGDKQKTEEVKEELTEAERTVLDLFGLTGNEKDSEGGDLSFFTFSKQQIEDYSSEESETDSDSE